MNETVYVVLPAFNEASRIGSVVENLRSRFPHVVVVDDGSVDATGDRARVAGATVIHHGINRGQGAALQTGMEWALWRGAEFVVTFDSDGQHRLEDAEAMVAAIRQGQHDVILGSRFLQDDRAVPVMRRLILKLAVLFTRLVSGIEVTDTHNGLRVFSRRAAEQIRIRQDRMAHASEILDEIGRLGLTYREVPTRILYSRYSRDKGQRSTAAFRIAFDFLVGRSKR